VIKNNILPQKISQTFMNSVNDHNMNEIKNKNKTIPILFAISTLELFYEKYLIKVSNNFSK